jgi:hypothetical protein
MSSLRSAASKAASSFTSAATRNGTLTSASTARRSVPIYGVVIVGAAMYAALYMM